MSAETQRYLRFRLIERVEHFVLILSFTTLALTGLPQKYALNPVSQAVIGLLGGIETIRIIHHIAAAIFLLEAVYHVVIVGYKLFVERKQATMIPVVKDATDAFQWFTFNLGIGKTYPKMPRYNFTEKAEYLAMLWGLILMGLTGLMLWNPIATTNYLPGEFIPAAKAAHGAEAVLAVLAIILWHFYNVHIKHWNWGMIRGFITGHEMEEEHAQELEQIETGRVPARPAGSQLRQRLMLFVPVAAVFTVVLVGLTYFFLTFEKTSITTLPPAEQVAVYKPQTPTPAPQVTPTATLLPQQPASGTTVVWTGQIESMMKQKCVSCHGSAGGFNAESYDNVMKAVTAGSPDNSKIVQVQQTGTHPGQLTPDEVSLLVNWVQGGALKDAGAGGAAAQPTTQAGAETWATGISDLFKTKCGTCHGTSGGFTATTYEDATKMLKPGDPDNSTIVQVQKKGGHPGMFSEDELNRVINWIKVGAPQQ